MGLYSCASAAFCTLNQGKNALICWTLTFSTINDFKRNKNCILWHSCPERIVFFFIFFTLNTVSLRNAFDFYSIGWGVRILTEIFHVRVECHLTIGSLMLFNYSIWKKTVLFFFTKSQNRNDGTPSLVIQFPSKVTCFSQLEALFYFLKETLICKLFKWNQGDIDNGLDEAIIIVYDVFNACLRLWKTEHDYNLSNCLALWLEKNVFCP